MDDRENVFDYITKEVINYKTQSVSLGENWQYNMHDHINKSFLFKHSKFSQGSNDLGKRPFKNIIRPILNVAYRSEGFDVKDVEPFVDNSDYYYKSLLVRKFHPRWALTQKIDTAIDESVESYVDYGGALLKNVNEVKPEVVPLQRIAFCDQRDILSGAICEKHDYSIDQLVEMKGKWNADKIDEVITLSRASKSNSEGTGTEKTPSKSIEVYELHGNFPETWLDPEGDPQKYTKQIHIVTYYKGALDKKVGVALFQGKESKQIYKFLPRDEIYNRGLGWGGVEELFEPQIWTNYSIIQIKEMLDVASLMLLQTTDKNYAQRSKVSDLKKGEILSAEQPITQVNIQPVNMQDFILSINAWEQSARTTGSASDPQLGLDPVSGTPLGTTQIVTSQGEGIHQYRRGKVAVFWEEIYREWILPAMVKELNKGQVFLEELSTDELQDIVESVVTCVSNDRIKQMVLAGQNVTPEQGQVIKDLVRSDFLKGGTKRFFEVFKGELDDLPVEVRMNVAGKEKNMSQAVDKLSNVFRAIIANPQGFAQAMQLPAVSKTFNQMLEYSGLNQINFGSMPKIPLAPQGA